MKLFKNRMFLGAVCILIAAALAFLVAPMLTKSSQNEVTMYLAQLDIDKGSQLTAEDLTTGRIPEKYLPKGAVTSADAIIGKYAAVDLFANDTIYAEKLSAEPTVQNNWKDELDENSLAMSVSIKSFAAGLSAKLEPEDIISLIAVSTKEEKATVIPEQLRYVRVLAVTTDTASEYDAQSTGEENASLPSTLTVMVTPEQAVVLADLEINSNLYTALVSRGDDDKATALLAEQRAALTDAEAEPESTPATEDALTPEAIPAESEVPAHE